MCLSIKNEFDLDVQKDGYIKGWKVVRSDNRPELRSGPPYRVGINCRAPWEPKHGTIGSHFSYEPGIHVFLDQEAALTLTLPVSGYWLKMIEVFFRPEDIIVTGEENWCDWRYHDQPSVRVAVVKQIVIKSLEPSEAY